VREIKKHVREKKKNCLLLLKHQPPRLRDREPEIPTIDVWLRSFFLFLSFSLCYYRRGEKE
jgi:hypothetical protein